METPYKLRAKFMKAGELRWLSQLDISRAVSRALRRASVSVAFSQGFSPHPKISFGQALPVGISSRAEYFDISLAEELAPDDFKRRLNAVLPESLRIIVVARLREDGYTLGKLAKYNLYEVNCGPNPLTEGLLDQLVSSQFIDALEGVNIKSGDRQVALSGVRDIDFQVKNGDLYIRILSPSNVGARPLMAGIEKILGVDFPKAAIERTAQYANLAEEFLELIDPKVLGGD